MKRWLFVVGLILAVACLSGCMKFLIDRPRLLFAEDFSTTNPSGWWQGYDADAAATWEIQSGHYYGHLGSADSWYCVTNTEVDALTDFSIQATATQIGTSSDASWGIVFREENGSFYSFEIYADGYAVLSVRADGDWDDLYDEPCPAIRSGQPNVLRVDARGKFFSLYVNGSLFAQVTDDTLSSGSVGFIVETWDDPDGGAWFDDLEVWSLDE